MFGLGHRAGRVEGMRRWQTRPIGPVSGSQFALHDPQRAALCVQHKVAFCADQMLKDIVAFFLFADFRVVGLWPGHRHLL